ncbi:DUF3078 domain-containing protein [Flectobacillus major]|jgi:hypothetical protein|uniref:DUF3078 domain-containing protein n=1 Tax=Flectobacillus major TaxID=103 RepID=UPI00131EE3C5|nr:DUF3078 domain-containing protein [Flectobacillus major]
MLKKIIISLSLLLCSFLSNAQEVKRDTSYWKKKTSFGTTFNQASFNGPWQTVQGARGSVGLNVFFNAKGEYNKAKVNWVNDLQLQYGLLDNGNGLRKTIDRVFFDTKLGQKFAPEWLFFANFNFQTQFTKGYNYDAGPEVINPDGTSYKEDVLVSNLFSPAFITESIGFEWKPSKMFNMTFAPGALRQTIVADKKIALSKPGERYGVPDGQTIRNEVALMQIVANLDKDIAKNINLKCRYAAFIKYNNLGAIDNRLDAKFTAKVNKYISTTFDVIVLYFQDQSTQVQVAQNLGVGLLYTFP